MIDGIRKRAECQRKREVDRRRGTAAQRGYDAAWRKVRLAVLRDEPLCRMCKEAGRITPAVDVDHIIAIADRPDLRLDPSNLRPLCKSCHSSRTARDQGFNRGKRSKGQRGCDAHGMPLDPEHHWHSS